MTRRVSWPLAAAFCLGVAAPAAQAYEGSSFNQVWDAVRSDPYAKPHNKVTLASFYDYTGSLIQQAASRTISDLDDLLPRFTKLVHANGICLKGDWFIDQASPYTGYFAKGSHALFIARASTAESATEAGQSRAFGFSGKLFPTLNPNDKVATANFVAIDDLGGTMTQHFLDAPLTNEPGTNIKPPDLPLAAAVALAFIQVDTHIGIRQMYQYSEAGLKPGEVAKTPHWFRVLGRADQPRVNEADFRDELNPVKYSGSPIIFDIAVADQQDLFGQKDWQTIGHIELDDAVISDSCDHRLHFHHPKWRDDLKN